MDVKYRVRHWRCLMCGMLWKETDAKMDWWGQCPRCSGTTTSDLLKDEIKVYPRPDTTNG